MPDTPRRWLLRERTTALHETVDAAIGSFDTIRDYKAYLRQMSAFRLPVESSLQDVLWPACFHSWRPTAIAPELEQDLLDLGVALPREARTSTPQGVEQLMGVTYVLQGSSLGAQVLLRRAQALGLSENFGARHLAAQADGVAQWREFLALLEAVPDIDMDQVAKASSATFHLATGAFKSDPIPA